MRDIQQYVELSTSIEQNGPRVTNGEWSKVVKLIIEKHPECGQVTWESRSVEELFRVVGSLAAHRFPSELKGVALKKVQAKMVYLIMHVFSFHARHISKEQVLMLFADTFIDASTHLYKRVCPSVRHAFF